jgi:hypothetical protein
MTRSIYLIGFLLSEPLLGQRVALSSFLSDDLVVLEGSHGVGTFLTAYRGDPVSKSPVPLGTIRVLRQDAQTSIARVETSSTEASQKLFPDYPSPMAGDWAEPQTLAVTQKQYMLPIFSFLYRELFSDPQQGSKNFELSQEGKDILDRALAGLQGKGFGRLLIHSYLDEEGDFDANQIESFQRSESIRQHLITRWSMDKERVVPIGWGESILADQSGVSGQKERNSRIRLELIP